MCVCQRARYDILHYNNVVQRINCILYGRYTKIMAFQEFYKINN